MLSNNLIGMQVLINPWLIGDNWIIDPTDSNRLFVSKELYEKMKNNLIQGITCQ